jgi:hypothetical protein
VIALNELGLAWQRLFHTPEPVATLCVFRLLFGLLLIVNACNLLLYADDFFGPDGLLSVRGWAKTYPRQRLSVFYLLPPDVYTARGVVICLLAASTAMAVGVLTQLSTVVAWICLVSLHHRNPAIFNAGDTLQRLLLFLLCFAPSGRALSLDSWLSGENPFFAMRDNHFDPWPLRLIQIQITVVYLRAVFWKLRGKPWRDGTAVALVLNTMSLRRFGAPIWTTNRTVSRLLTYGTLTLEATIPWLLWIRELRYTGILLGLALHAAFELFLNVHLFGLTMCIGLISFIPPDDMLSLFRAE